MPRLFFILPVVLFLVLLAIMFWGLNSERDPSALPSALVGKPAPAFVLPDLLEERAVDSAVLADGRPKLVNFFASWCIPCLAEHPLLQEISVEGKIALLGIAWKNKEEEAKIWLRKHGNPYQTTLFDLDGRTGIDWGISGVPETFLVDGKGNVLFRHAGPLTRDVIAKRLGPLMEAELN